MVHRALVVGLCASIFTAATASADVATEARFFDEVARRAYAARQYEKALQAFQLVHEIAPSYRMLYNAALCADLASRDDMAFSLYEEYLRSDDPDATRRSEAERRVEGLRRKLALVEITSDPPGAIVYVDRKELGRFGSTPTVIAVAEGEHRLLLERPGSASGSVTVAARGGSQASVSASLEPLLGWVTVSVTPSSADVRFLRDGIQQVAAAEHGRYHLPVGPYRVVAAAPGYVSADAQVIVRESEEIRLDLGLAPMPHETGRLLVSTGKITADVVVDGRRVAVTPATLSDLGAGEHTLEVRAGRRVAKRRVVIKKGHATYVAVDLESGPR